MPEQTTPSTKAKAVGAPSRAPSFDRVELLSKFEGDEEIAREVIEVFLEDCSRSLGEVRQAVAEKDPHKVKCAAHSLKGAVGNFAAEDAYQTAFSLETMGSGGDLGGCDAAYRTLEARMHALESELRVFLTELQAKAASVNG